MKNRLVWVQQNGLAFPQIIPGDMPINNAKRVDLHQVIEEYDIPDEDNGLTLDELAEKYPAPIKTEEPKFSIDEPISSEWARDVLPD